MNSRKSGEQQVFFRYSFPAGLIGIGVATTIVVWIVLSGLPNAKQTVNQSKCEEQLNELWKEILQREIPISLSASSLLGTELEEMALAKSQELNKLVAEFTCPCAIQHEASYTVNPFLHLGNPPLKLELPTRDCYVVVYEARLRHHLKRNIMLERRGTALILFSDGSVRMWKGTSRNYERTIQEMSSSVRAGTIAEFYRLAENAEFHLTE